MIDEADERPIEKVARENGGEQRRDEAGAAIECDRRQRPDSDDRKHAGDGRNECRNLLDVVAPEHCGPASRTPSPRSPYRGAARPPHIARRARRRDRR